MTSDSRTPLRDGVYAALLADAALIAVVPAAQIVTGHSQTGAQKPYIRLGRIEGGGADTKTTDGMEGRFEIHVFSTQLTDSDAHAVGVESIQPLINAALSTSLITVAGHSLTVWVLDYVDSFDAGDGDTYHGIQRFRFMTCED